MKILLIKPLYSFKSFHPVQFSGAEKTLPLSLAYIAAVLERDGHIIQVVDYQVDKSKITDVFKEFAPDIVGITAYSKEFTHALKIMKDISHIDKNISVIIGGPHVNAYQEKVFEQTDLPDYLVLQEGEETIRELVTCLENNYDVKKVNGIIYREDRENIVRTEKRSFIKDLDNLPFMALRYFKVVKYYPEAGTFRRLPSVTMVTSRGCPYQCTFCNTDLFGKNVRLRSAENVVDEIEYIVKTYHAKEINFCDETLTINRQRMFQICEGILQRNLKIEWKCSTRVDQVDADLLKFMKKSGCFLIGYGVESGSQRVLESLKKGITLEKIRNAFYETRKAGITSMAYFMMNVPGETIEDIEQSIKFSREIKPDFLNFELIKPYRGTELRDIIENAPNITINTELWDKWEEYSAGNRLFYVQKGVPKEYLHDAYKRAVKNFYLNPQFIFKAILQIRSFRQLKSYVRSFLNMLRVKMVTNKEGL